MASSEKKIKKLRQGSLLYNKCMNWKKYVIVPQVTQCVGGFVELSFDLGWIFLNPKLTSYLMLFCAKLTTMLEVKVDVWGHFQVEMFFLKPQHTGFHDQIFTCITQFHPDL